MRPWAHRLLHVLACAPVAAVLAGSSAPVTHARADTVRPAPYVVAIDAGHGGTPDNAHPDQLFDPGVIGTNGLQEKDVTLDVAKRVQRLLGQQRVRVVMTRTDDRWIDIGPRMQAAEDAHASLFVSIHFNSYQDPSTGGSTILYPGDTSAPFAQVLSDTVGARLAPLGIADDGIQLKDDLWVHAAMPAATVEAAYLSNPREADQLRNASTRDAIATGVVAGIDKQAPEVATRRAAILGWEKAQGMTAGTGVIPRAAVGTATAQGGHLLRDTLLVLVTTFALWQRRWVFPLVWLLLRLLGHSLRLAWRLGRRLVAGEDEDRQASSRHRRRLRENRRQALLARSRAPVSRLPGRPTARRSSMVRASVYDELPH